MHAQNSSAFSGSQTKMVEHQHLKQEYLEEKKHGSNCKSSFSVVFHPLRKENKKNVLIGKGRTRTLHQLIIGEMWPGPKTHLNSVSAK